MEGADSDEDLKRQTWELGNLSWESAATGAGSQRGRLSVGAAAYPGLSARADRRVQPPCSSRSSRPGSSRCLNIAHQCRSAIQSP